MKKSLLIVFALLICSFAFAYQANDPFSLIEQTPDHVDIEFNLPRFEISTVTKHGITFDKIEHELCGYVLQAGKPELPSFSTYVQLPDFGNARLEILSTETSELHLSNPFYPSQGADAYEDLELPFAWDKKFYRSNKIFPTKMKTFGEPFIMRDLRLSTISMYPYTMDMANNMLIMNTKITLRVHFDNSTGLNEIENRHHGISRNFEPIYESTVVNYNRPGANRYFEYQKPSILVVFKKAASFNMTNELNTYVDWKRQKGYIVHVADPDSIGTSNSAIKNYISDFFAESSNPPEFITLIGDVSGSIYVPTWMHSFSAGRYNGSGDAPYSHLLGDDFVPDVFIGRISVENINHLSSIIEKTDTYERSPYMGSTDWFRNAVLAADTTPSGPSTISTIKYIQETIALENPDFTFDYHFSTQTPYTSLNPSLLNSDLETGASQFFFRGWLGMDGWANMADSAQNPNSPFNAVILTCGTGSFDYTATTENALRSGSTSGSPRGAISAIGLATSGTHTTFNNILTAGMAYGLFTDKMRTMGASMYRGVIALHRAYSNSNPNKYYTFAHICNQMGDPVCNIWVDVPKDLNIMYSPFIDTGAGNVEITVDDLNAAGIKNAWVTIWKAGANATDYGDVLASGYTNSAGLFIASFDPESVGTYTITASKDDYLPDTSELILAGNNAVTINDINIVYDYMGDVPAANNLEVNPGETIEFELALKNTLGTSLDDISGTINSSSEYVTVIDVASTWDNIFPTAALLSNSRFKVTINADCPDNQKIWFDLALSSSNGLQARKFILTVLGGDIEIESVTYGNANNYLNPGETASISLDLKNAGFQDLTGVYVKLISNDYRISTDVDSSFYGTIAVNQIANNILSPFVVRVSSQVLTGMSFDLDIEIVSDTNHRELETFTLQIGNAGLTDPLGPDNYGYFIYDDNDVDYLDCPEYDWIEIAPEHGGSGTSVGLTDLAPGDDSDDVVVIDLPNSFTFSMYGQEYSQISICSNGFIAMGATEQWTMRNWRLPGALGPGPMIAAMWDDLYIPSGGGVYYYYDASEDYFVIEWDDVQIFQHNALQKFQIILYDVDSYPTLTGDGRIKMQYHSFTNEDYESNASTTHGNYCTIGIQNAEHTDGLEYTHNNEYPSQAKIITAGTALYISGSPMFSEDAYLMLGEVAVHDENANGFIESGEGISLGIATSNIGNSTAMDASGTIAIEDEYVSIIRNNANYPHVPSEEQAFNLDFYSIYIDPNCPNGHSFMINVRFDNEENFWNYRFELTVQAPSYAVKNILINDITGNGDGAIDPGENVHIGFDVFNYGKSPITNVVANISTSDARVNLAIDQTVLNLNYIPSLANVQASFALEVLDTFVIDTTIDFDLVITMGTGLETEEIYTDSFTVLSLHNPSLFANDFSERLPDGWTTNGHDANWVRSGSTSFAGGSAPEMKFYWRPSFNGRSELITPVVNIAGAANPHITFRHRLKDYQGVNNYRIGVAYRTEDGPWNTIWEEPGGANIFANEVDLPISDAIANMRDLQYCWYFDGDSNGLDGWYIDDIMLNAVLGNTAIINGTATGSTNNNDILVSLGGKTVHPAADGSFTAYVPAGIYDDITASQKYHESVILPGFTLDFGDVVNDQDFTITPYHAPFNIVHEFANNPNRINLTWEHVTPARFAFQSFNIYRRRDAGPLRLLANINALEYSDDNNIATGSHYSYYIEALYDTGLSMKATLLDILFPTGIMYGDIDGDSEVTTDDVGYILAHLLGGEPQLTEGQLMAADIFGTQAINAYTCNVMHQKIMGLIDYFPIEGEFTAEEGTLTISLEEDTVNETVHMCFAASESLRGVVIKLPATATDFGSFEEVAPHWTTAKTIVGDQTVIVMYQHDYPMTLPEYEFIAKVPLINTTVHAIEAMITNNLVELTDTIALTGADDPNAALAYTRLIGNYPNPFNPSTTFKFNLATAGQVEFNIYNVKGQMVKNLFSERMSAGSQELTWDGLADDGKKVSSSVYFYKLKTKDHTSIKKAILLK